MASMSTKEAKRRGLIPRSNGSTGVSTMYGDNLMLNLTGRDPEPIMFGGLGRINMFGNDTDAKMGGGENREPAVFTDSVASATHPKDCLTQSCLAVLS